MANSAGEWCLIESDPGVFSELIRGIGVKGVQVEEVYSLEPESFANLKPVYGLIFLFKWRNSETDTRPTLEYGQQEDIFFASQVINNACATQAILSVLMNCPHIELGEELDNFKTFTREFPAELKGLAISNSEKIRSVHNSFARNDAFLLENEPKSENHSSEDLFHFVAYLPIKGRMYELDGLKRGPIDLGGCTEEIWLESIAPAIQSRIDQYSKTEIHFNLMAVVKDRLSVTRESIRILEAEKATLLGQQSVDVSSEHSTPQDCDERLNQIEQELGNLNCVMDVEKEKNERYRIDNIRRKHNYLPFFIETLKLLAQKNELAALIEEGKRKATM
eukprot:Sdes_comp13281_c0_seq1m3126